ncbi:MAG: nitrous oxide-stimulated promoter family protein [Coriobacteriaceae bacterium]|nr:nitrous oxide-stimulated promoter family protein [Coriobacteriaceae bacterium]
MGTNSDPISASAQGTERPNPTRPDPTRPDPTPLYPFLYPFRVNAHALCRVVKACYVGIWYSAPMEDSSKIRTRRQREKRTISQMLAIYCEAHHAQEVRNQLSYGGELLCSECLILDDYAVMRTERCRKMDVKTSCEECGNHCYEPSMRQSIREVMRYAGPRMIKKHPVAAVRHLLKR